MAAGSRGAAQNLPMAFRGDLYSIYRARTQPGRKKSKPADKKEQIKGRNSCVYFAAVRNDPNCSVPVLCPRADRHPEDYRLLHLKVRSVSTDATSGRQRDREQGRGAPKAAGGQQKTLFITSEEAAKFPGTLTVSIIDRKCAGNRHSQEISND